MIKRSRLYHLPSFIELCLLFLAALALASCEEKKQRVRQSRAPVTAEDAGPPSAGLSAKSIDTFTFTVHKAQAGKNELVLDYDDAIKCDRFSFVPHQPQRIKVEPGRDIAHDFKVLNLDPFKLGRPGAKQECSVEKLPRDSLVPRVLSAMVKRPQGIGPWNEAQAVVWILHNKMHLGELSGIKTGVIVPGDGGFAGGASVYQHAHLVDLRNTLRSLGIDEMELIAFQDNAASKKRNLEALKPGGYIAPEVSQLMHLRMDQDDERAVLGALLKLFPEPEPFRREHALDGVGAFGEKTSLGEAEIMPLKDVAYQIALNDANELQRMYGAIALHRLGDIRPVPLLLQWIEAQHFDPTSQDVQRKAEDTLTSSWQRRQIAGASSWKELWENEGGWDSPRFAALPIAGIRGLHESERNIAGELPELEARMRRAETKEERLEVLRKLRRDPRYERHPRTSKLFAARLAEEPAAEVRRELAHALAGVEDPQINEILLKQFFAESDAAALGKMCYALGHNKVHAAVPRMIELLEPYGVGTASYDCRTALENMFSRWATKPSRQEWTDYMREKHPEVSLTPENPAQAQ